jgi:GNAT superfamily N-acetyltransferase
MRRCARGAAGLGARHDAAAQRGARVVVGNDDLPLVGRFGVTHWLQRIRQPRRADRPQTSVGPMVPGRLRASDDCRVAGERAGTVVVRPALPSDARVIAEIVAEGFRGYRAWAPPGWSPPRRSEGEQAAAELGEALARPDVWCLLARGDAEPAGHVALSLFTFAQPEPPPPGAINLWQLFVRPLWQGGGLAARLLEAAVVEARLRGYVRMRLWTPHDAGRARRFYEREGWTTTGRARVDSPLGLPIVEYERRLDVDG